MERTREYEGENNRHSLSQMMCRIMTLIITEQINRKRYRAMGSRKNFCNLCRVIARGGGGV